VRIDFRWSAGDDKLARRYAAELVALAPDVIVAAGGLPVRSLLDATATVPIVFDALDPSLDLTVLPNLLATAGEVIE
jgi:putative ABC transport system substrate-binding protein